MIKLCNKAGSQCRSTQLYERCDMGVTSTKNDVIPVPRHWDPENLIVNEHTRWLYSKSWIPVSATCMTPSATQITCILQCSYTEMLQRWDNIFRDRTLRAHNCESSKGLM